MRVTLNLSAMRFNTAGDKKYYYSTAAERFVERGELGNPELKAGRCIPAPKVDHEEIRRRYAARMEDRRSGDAVDLTLDGADRAAWRAADDVLTGHDNFRSFERACLEDIAEQWCLENELSFRRREDWL